VERRGSAWAGIASAALLVPISILLVSSDYPFADATTEEVREYLLRERTPVIAALLLEMVAIAALLWFAAGLAGHLHRSGASVEGAALVLVAGAASTFSIALEDAAVLAAAFRAPGTAVGALWELAHFGLGTLVHLFSAIWLASAAMVGLRSMPHHLTAVAVVAAVGNAAILAGLLTHDVDYVAGVVEHLLATLPWAVWLVVTSLEMMASDARGQPQASQAHH
jgi:hypothetical protein